MNGNTDNPSGDAPYGVLLVVSAGLRDFTANTLETLKRAGIARTSIHLFCSDAAAAEMRSLGEEQLPANVQSLDRLFETQARAGQEDYSDYGSAQFGRFTLHKWRAIKQLMESGVAHVVYTDVDIAWRMNPIPLLLRIAEVFDLAVQTECQPIFPPLFCTGFMSLKRSAFTLSLLEHLIKAQSSALAANPEVHDQKVFNHVVSRNRALVKRIYPLSEAVFPNGLLARLFSTQDAQLSKLATAQVRPAIFHANFTVGLENKRRLLKRTGNWHS
jgi:hypothetical protein